MQNIDAINLISKQVVIDKDSMPVLTQVLRIAIYDEYRAFESYKAIIATHDVKAPFTNIMQAELRHYEALIELCKKYEVEPPVNDIAGTIVVPKTLQECYELGVAYEIENIQMYDYLISYVGEYPDVLDTLYKLQAASFNNHLPTFREHVKSTGIAGISQDEVMAKINDFGEMAQKVISGETNPQELAKILNQTNISLLTGLLAGGVGSFALNQFFQDDKEK